MNAISLISEFEFYERGTTKKQAAAMCSLKMIRKLFQEKLIERFGDAVIPLDIDTTMNEYAAKQYYYVPKIEVKKSHGNSKKIKQAKKEQNTKQKVSFSSFDSFLPHNYKKNFADSYKKLF